MYKLLFLFVVKVNMQSSLLLPNEKIVSTRKISVLFELPFWVGITCVALSIISFFMISILVPRFLPLSEAAKLLGIIVSGYLGEIPLLPVILLLIGFIYLLYAELKVLFKEYIVTNSRIIIEKGIITKTMSVLLPAKIEDVSVTMNAIERLFGVGKVVIMMQEDAQRPIILNGIKEPYKFQADIINLIGGGPAPKKISEDKPNGPTTIS